MRRPQARWSILACVLACALTRPVLAQPATTTGGPDDAVFQLVTYDREPDAGGAFAGHGFGTGFFIGADGTAITVSHVTFLAATRPHQYRLLAVMGKEFYDVNVVCASRLPYDPSKPNTLKQGIPATRDVAKVKVVPSTAFEGRKDTLFYRLKDGTTLEWAKAHTGPLPEFHFLTPGNDPGRHVRIIGYGAISAIPYKWTAEGLVSDMYDGRDGTPMFDVTSRNPAVPGDSGSPVLNDAGQVVGLWVWHYGLHPETGTAQRASVLANPCR